MRPSLCARRCGRTRKYIFARHAIFGEGPSEEIVLPRLAEAHGIPIDRSFVAIVPIGGRHIQHFWRLVEQLGIPHTTLLDLDLGRSSGDDLQFKAAAKALQDSSRILPEVDRQNVTKALSNQRPVVPEGGKVDVPFFTNWSTAFERQGIFMSGPLDLDMLMLSAFPAAYKKLPAVATGPQNVADPARQEAAGKRVLGEGGLGLAAYTELPERALFPWYAYLFLGARGKPAVHLAALGELDDLDIEIRCPPVLHRLIKHVQSSLEAPLA